MRRSVRMVAVLLLSTFIALTTIPTVEAQELPDTETINIGVLVSGTFPTSLEFSDDDKRVFDEELVVIQDDSVYPDTETLNGITCTGTFPTSIQTDDNDYRSCDEVSSVSTTNFSASTQTIMNGTQSSGTFPDDMDDSNDVRVIYAEENMGAAPTDLQVDTQTIVLGTLESGTFPTDVRLSNDAYVTYREEDTGGAGGPETWYMRNTNVDVLSCGTDLNLDASETAGSSQTSHVLDGTYDYWYEPTNARTLAAGNWVVDFWTTTASGGGPPGRVTVFVERITSGCGVQQEIVNEQITMNSGTTQEYSSTPVDPGQVILASGERIIVRFAKTGGNRAVTLLYNDAEAGQADTQLQHPGPAGVANYEINIEYHWATETCTDTRRLRIEAYHTGEDIDVQVVDSTESSWTTRLTIIATVDPDSYLTYDLTSDEWDAGDPDIRFLGTVESGDTTQHDLIIDHAQILCVPQEDYQLDLEFHWTGVDTSGTEHRLFVEARLGVTNPENMEVLIFDSDEVGLSAVVCTVSSTTESEYDCGTMTADQLDTGTPDILVRDITSPDALQSSLEIDRIRIQRTGTTYSLNFIQYDWVDTITLVDYLNLSIRGNRTGDTEDVNIDVWDWDDNDWNTARIVVNVAAEALFEVTLVPDCAAPANDCERSSTDDVRIRVFTSPDATQTTMNTDELWIRLVDESFQMEIVYDWTAVPSDDIIRLTVEANRTQDTETINVQVLTPPSTWNTRITVTTTSDTTETYDLTVDEFNSGAPSVRFDDIGGVGGGATRLAIDRLVIDSIAADGNGVVGLSIVWVMVPIAFAIVFPILLGGRDN